MAPAGATARPDTAVMSRLLHIGYPAAIEGILFQGGLWFFMRLLAPYGTEAVAAYNVGAQILAFSFLPGLGFGAAAATLVGQHLGEGDPAAAARSGWRSMGGAILAMSAIGARDHRLRAAARSGCSDCRRSPPSAPSTSSGSSARCSR